MLINGGILCWVRMDNEYHVAPFPKICIICDPQMSPVSQIQLYHFISLAIIAAFYFFLPKKLHLFFSPTLFQGLWTSLWDTNSGRRKMLFEAIQKTMKSPYNDQLSVWMEPNIMRLGGLCFLLDWAAGGIWTAWSRDLILSLSPNFTCTKMIFLKCCEGWGCQSTRQCLGLAFSGNWAALLNV